MMLIVTEYGNRNSFLTLFNPTKQADIVNARNDRWLTGDFPTLGELNSAYGSNMSNQWLMVQLLDLSEYCGCKEKFTIEQIEECARVINAKYYYLKVTELMKFFFDMKAGVYGRFYGSIDPMIITSSLIAFVNDRNAQIDRIEQEENRKRIEKHKVGTITYQEYLRMKKSPTTAENPQKV